MLSFLKQYRITVPNVIMLNEPCLNITEHYSSPHFDEMKHFDTKLLNFLKNVADKNPVRGQIWMRNGFDKCGFGRELVFLYLILLFLHLF